MPSFDAHSESVWSPAGRKGLCVPCFDAHSESVWSPTGRKGLCMPYFDAHTVRVCGHLQIEKGYVCPVSMHTQ
jgi:hypothetical protein